MSKDDANESSGNFNDNLLLCAEICVDIFENEKLGDITMSYIKDLFETLWKQIEIAFDETY